MENANKANGDVESDGSDSSDSIYNPPPDLTRENQPTDPDHFPYTNPSSSVDVNQYSVPDRESSLRGQSHPAVYRGPFGQQRISQQERYPAHSRHPGAQAVTKSAYKYGTHTSSQFVPPEPMSMSSADIQGAATLMSLGHDANLEYSASTTSPIVTQTPQRNYPPHILHSNTQVTGTPSTVNPGLPNINPVSYPDPDWIILPPTRTRGENYRLQEGSVRSPAHESVGYPQSAQNFNYSTRLPEPEALMYVPYRDPRPPVGWPVLPPLQFHTNSYDRHQSSIGLVRAPIGSPSRIGNSPWKLAAHNEVPDFRMTGTPADRKLDIFYVPNADGEFPSHNQPRSSLAQTHPLTMAPYQNPPLPEDEISGIRMGSEDEEGVEQSVHVNEQTPIVINDNPPHRTTIGRNQPRVTIVIDDDMPSRDRPVTPRPSKIKWPEDVGIRVPQLRVVTDICPVGVYAWVKTLLALRLSPSSRYVCGSWLYYYGCVDYWVIGLLRDGDQCPCLYSWSRRISITRVVGR